MADYFSPTVVQQIILDADMTPLERLLLSRIFQSERHGDDWYFFAEERPSDIIFAERAELQEALETSPAPESAAHGCVTEQLAAASPDASEIELDFSGSSGEFFFQDILKRSKTLRYISIVTSFTCSKMRPDAFGGMVTLITRDAIVAKSTGDFLQDFIAEASLDEDQAPKATVPDTTPAASPPE